MCSKTCTISQLFCIVCTIIEIANTQPPITMPQFNYGLQGRPQLRGAPIMSNVNGIEQIVPINNLDYPPKSPDFYHQQRYMPTSQSFSPTSFGSVNQFNQQQFPFQQQQQQQNQQQFPFQQQQRRINHNRASIYAFAPHSPLNTPVMGGMPFSSDGINQIRSQNINEQIPTNQEQAHEIPMEIVLGHQIQDPAVAFGSLTANEKPIPMNHQQTLQSINDKVETKSVTENEVSSVNLDKNTELPKFLQGAPSEAIDAFKRIIRTPNSNYVEQVKQINEMVANKLDTQHQELYKEFMKENDVRENQHREKIHKIVSKMSDKAQEQFAKISAVLRNPSVPDQERWDRVINMYTRMDPDLRDEFEKEFKGFGTLQYFR